MADPSRKGKITTRAETFRREARGDVQEQGFCGTLGGTDSRDYPMVRPICPFLDSAPHPDPVTNCFI